MIIEPSNKITVANPEATYFELILTLSYCYTLARYYEKNLEVDVLWSDHFLDNDFYYKNWDETESSLDRFNFLHSMVDLKGDVEIQFNHKILEGGLYVGEDAKNKFQKNKCRPMHRVVQKFSNRPIIFSQERNLLWPLKSSLEKTRNKVTFWKPTFIHKMLGKADDVKWVGNKRRMGSSHKLYYYNEWNEILQNLRKNYHVVEVEYRTPIRELFYHLSTSEFSFGYNGLCHSISIALSTPTILCSHKPSSVLDYEHQINSLDNPVDMFENRDYVDNLVSIAKQRVSTFKCFYEKFFGY